MLYRRRRRRAKKRNENLTYGEDELLEDHFTSNRNYTLQQQKQLRAAGQHLDLHNLQPDLLSPDARVNKAIRDGLRDALAVLLDVTKQSMVAVRGDRQAAGQDDKLQGLVDRLQRSVDGDDDVVPAHTHGMALCHPSTSAASTHSNISTGRRRPGLQRMRQQQDLADERRRLQAGYDQMERVREAVTVLVSRMRRLKVDEIFYPELSPVLRELCLEAEG